MDKTLSPETPRLAGYEPAAASLGGRGLEQRSAHLAHNQEVEGSSPSPATNLLAAVAKLEAAANYLTGPYSMAQIGAQIKEGIILMSCPWVSREHAAVYASCSVREIDRAASVGIIPRYERGGRPVFKKSDIDTAIESGKWTTR